MSRQMPPIYSPLPAPSLSQPSPVQIQGTPFADDLRDMEEIQTLIEQGEAWVRKLYISRYVARALPNTGARNDDRLSKAMYDVLRPKIVLLIELEKFQRTLANRFVQMAAVKRQAPNLVQARLVHLVDVIASLDLVKDMKSAHQNDFAAYKRAVKNARNSIADPLKIENEIQVLETFMADRTHPRYTMLTTLKRCLHVMTGADHTVILMDLLTYACNELEQDRLLFPEDKWRYIRFIVHGLLLLDAADEQIDTRDQFKPYHAFKNKRIVQLAAPWVKKHPLVPLFGEMHIELVHVLSQCPTFAADALVEEWVDDGELKKYDLAQHWLAARADFDLYMPRLAALLSRARAEDPQRMDADFADKIRAERQSAPLREDVVQRLARSAQVQTDALDTCLAGLRLLARWKELVTNQTILKYSRGATALSGSGGGEPGKRRSSVALGGGGAGGSSNSSSSSAGAREAAASVATDYESVVRANYSPPEVGVLLDFVALSKSLANVLSCNADVLGPLLRLRVYVIVQEFAQLRLCRLAHHASKRKRTQALGHLLRLRTLAADWLDGRNREPDDYKQKHAPPKVHKLEDTGEAVLSNAPKRVGASPAQLQVMLMYLELLHDPDKSESVIGGFLTSMVSSQDVDRAGAEVMRGFYNIASHFSSLLSLGESVEHLANLGTLWLREFYLEMSKSVQFPIDLSLPFILVKHVVEQPPVMATAPCSLLFALEIYNDAATLCLKDLQCAFLFDELEAEVALVVEQLAFLVADHAYTYAKALASSRHMDPACRVKLSEYKRSGESRGTFLFKQKLEEDRYLLVSSERIAALLAQRRVRLLGRSVDLQSLITAQIDDYVRADLDLCLGRFESSGLSSACELSSVLKVVRQTHASLVEWLPGMDAFDDVLRQVDLRLSSFRGRMAAQALAEVVGDVMVNHAFNSASERFVRAPRTGVPNDIVRPPKRSNAAPNFLFGAVHRTAFNEIFALDKEFIGLAHATALLDVVGLDQLAYVLDSVVAAAEQRLDALFDCLDGIKLSLAALSPTGNATELFALANSTLRAFLNDTTRMALALQLCREIGNALAFLRLCHNAVALQDQSDFARTCVWTGLDQASDDLFAPRTVEVEETPLFRETSGGLAVENALAPFLDGLRLTRVLPSAVDRLVPIVRRRAPGDDRLRAWSALLFALCLEGRLYEFGQGVVWAVALGVTASGARNRFETSDLAIAIADAHRLHGGQGASKELQSFVDSFARVVRPSLDALMDLLAQQQSDQAAASVVAFHPVAAQAEDDNGNARRRPTPATSSPSRPASQPRRPGGPPQPPPRPSLQQLALS